MRTTPRSRAGRKTPEPATLVALAAAVDETPVDLVTTAADDVSLRDLRKYAGLSRQRLATHLGDRSGRRYQDIELGRRVPTHAEIVPLAKALRVSRRRVEDACRPRAATDHLNDAPVAVRPTRRGVTIAELAEQHVCSPTRMRAVLREHGLTHPRPPKFDRLYDRDWIVAQMAADRTQTDIARELGCGKSAVSRAVHRYVGRRHPQLHDPEWLTAQVNAGHSLKHIARTIGSDYKSVGAALERHGISRPSKRS